MFRRRRWSLKDRVEDLEKNVQYKDMDFADTGMEMDIGEAVAPILKHLNLKVGLQNKK